MPKPTIVLVHGAWADASSWNAVASELQGQGFTVLAPPNLLRGVAIDAPYITSFVTQRTEGPVVLAGHSYGGFVISNAASGAENVKALVYVDAFIPEEGEFVFQILGGSGSALDVPDPTTVLDLVGYPGAPEGDVEAFLKPATVHSSFAQDLSEPERALIATGQRPITLGANTTPSGPGAWKRLPSWAVVGTEDLVIPPDTQRHMAERAGATITEAAGSHVSMVSQPQVTIDALLAAAAEVGTD
jgi:pimeloyl-ACP methyl ester carboxylesterase